MSQQHRLNALLELLSVRGSLSVQEIVDELSVSAATARRDLNSLAEQHLAIRTHGGGSALGSGYELPLQYRIPRNAEAKAAIAEEIVNLTNFGDVVGLNGGTTLSEVSRVLGRSKHLIGREGEVGVTVVTNALNLAFELSIRPHVKIVVTGGVARRQSYELVGPLVGDMIGKLTLDLAILGVDGLSEEFGATTIHEGEADVSRQLASVAKRVIVAADASKLGRSTFARISPLESIDALVTNAPVDNDLARALDRASVQIIVAKAP